jgi:hypothetical protein
LLLIANVGHIGGKIVDKLQSLQSYYDEHAAQARRHEEQRERVTNLMLSIAGLLVGLITFAKLSLWALPAAVCIVLLGAYGFLFAGKHYERFRFHTEILRAIRHEIERVSEQPDEKAKSLSDLRSEGEEKHYKDFVWPRFQGTKIKPQANARSWIARQRLHVFWEFVHLLVVAIGLALCVAIGLNPTFKEEPTPLKVQVVSPTTTPSPAAEKEVPKATRPSP